MTRNMTCYESLVGRTKMSSSLTTFYVNFRSNIQSSSVTVLDTILLQNGFTDIDKIVYVYILLTNWCNIYKILCMVERRLLCIFNRLMVKFLQFQYAFVSSRVKEPKKSYFSGKNYPFQEFINTYHCGMVTPRNYDLSHSSGKTLNK